MKHVLPTSKHFCRRSKSTQSDACMKTDFPLLFFKRRITLPLVLLVIFWLADPHVDAQNVTAKEELQKGISFYKKGDFDSSELYLLSAVSLSKKSKDESTLLQAYNNLGNIQADLGNNVKALSYYQKALKKAEKIHDEEQITHLNKNIGALYMSWKRLEEALDYYLKAEKAAYSFKDEMLLADCYNNIGTVYEQQNKFDSAISRYEKALTIYTKNDFPEGEAMAYSNLAIIYKSLKEYDRSLEYNLKSLEISEQLKDVWMQAATLNNIGNLYGMMKNVPLAEKNCLAALKLSREIQALEIVYNVYENLAEIYQQTGNHSKALQYFRLFVQVKDSFINNENQRSFNELDVKYKTHKKELEIRNLQLDNDLKTAERDRAEKEKWIWVGGFIIFSLIAFLLFWIIWNKRKHAAEREKARLQMEATSQIYAAEQKERMRLAQDLHDGIGQRMTTLKMYASGMDLKNAVFHQMLDETIQEVRRVSHDIMPEIVNLGLEKSLRDIADKINLSNSIRCILNLNDLQKFTFEKSINNTLYKIILEITHNMLKHSECSQIEMSVFFKGNEVEFQIRDNGKGFDTRLISTSTGMGWQNVMARIKLLNGSIQIGSTSLGTTVKFALPYER